MAVAMIVKNPLGLVFEFSNSGAVRSIDVAPIRLSLRWPSMFSRSCANLYLRKRGSPYAYTPILGAESPSRFRATDGAFEARGSWSGLDYECVLQPAQSQLAWQWRVLVENKLDHAVEVDLIYVQDVGLRTLSPGLVNEYYASQYLDRRVFEDPDHGCVVCCRQNLKESVGHPWMMVACAGRAVAASTDGLQFFGRTFRSTGEPEALRADKLGGELSGESSVVAIQEEPFILGAAASHTSIFLGSYMPDHAQASAEADLRRLPELVRSAGDATPSIADGAFSAPANHRFQSARLLLAEDLSQDELVEHFGGEWRHLEEADGQLLSFFADGPRHVVLRAKEALVDRPHGHIMQAMSGYLPDERIMSTTAFACGVFNSHLTQGNTNFNTLLSVCSNPMMPALEGQRILVHLDDGDYFLSAPSAFEMGINHCRWIYKHGRTCLQVCTWTSPHSPRVNLDFKVVRGGPVRLLLTHQFDDLSGWTVTPGLTHEFIARPLPDSMVAERFPEAQFRMIVNSHDIGYTEALALDHETPRSSLFVLDVSETAAFCMSFVGEVDGPANAGRIQDADEERRSDGEAAVSAWRELSRDLTLRGSEPISAIREILPWYGLNALIHFLTPYGLEQFSGAAWGTRDVCQGPVDLLLCQEKYEQAKQVLRVLFSRQNPDGGWPQWWMFDKYRAVRADSAHGDVVYWCILALCSYLKTSGDMGFLDERLPYFHEDDVGPASATTLSEHVDQIIDLVVGSFVPGTALVQFGGGDWNDSLQPVSKDLARRLISSWTVQMCYQAFSAYSEVCERTGNTVKARELRDISARILADFNRYLVKDGVVAGYGLAGADQTIDVLLHPSDTTTGVRYSLLPMNRGVISGMFSREQAEHHLALIERHLKGPDGARLMDRPLRYKGGLQTIFQRAESSTYFGREIGLMYVHEHLRYAESQARMGRADGFLQALRQAIPVDYQEVVPQGDVRQANCYYSSSDVLFRNRYEADERYDDVIAGKTPLKSGWRVYSSGPGIYVALVVSRLLGLRIEFDMLIIDPVMAHSLDGLEAMVRFRECPVTFVYRVDGPGFGPRTISVNGKPAQFHHEDNPYRQGGAVMPLERFMGMLAADDNRVEIQL
jgi:1,2-beta-oligoglucan phosphorylase